MKNIDLTLYLVTDCGNLDESHFLENVRQACVGGVTLVQLREKTKTSRAYYELALKVKQITDTYHIPLIIDDRIDIALAVNAAGVHVGNEDLSVGIARRLLGNKKIVGATAKTIEAATQAERDGADYLGVGAIYPTTTKVKTKLTSVDTLCAICHAVQIPVGAIGGLNAQNIDILKGIPIQGICVVSAIMKQNDCRKATHDLKKKVHDILSFLNCPQH